MQQNNLEVRKEYMRDIYFDKKQGVKVADELMNLPEPPTAIVPPDDINGVIIVSALKDHGVKVPEEVCVISFNNTLMSDLATPPITSIDT